MQRPHSLNKTMEYVIKQIKTLEKLHPIWTWVLSKNWWCKQIYHICPARKFIHVPIVLFVFLVNIHIQTMWKLVQNISVQNVIKLSSVKMHLINTNITVLQKDIHVKFVKKDYSWQSDVHKHMKTHTSYQKHIHLSLVCRSIFNWKTVGTSHWAKTWGYIT